MIERRSLVTRTTEHTSVRVVLHLDGCGACTVQTGFPFLDQMLILWARHGLFDLEIECRPAEGDPQGAVEDVGGCIGIALKQACGIQEGIARTGSAFAPAGEHLARAVIEISGQPCLVYRVAASAPAMSRLDAAAMERFWHALVDQARIILHAELLYGGDGHPAYEAVFKAVGKALRGAVGTKPGRTGSSRSRQSGE